MARLNLPLERICGAGSAISGIVENVRSMSNDTERIEQHSAHLDAIDRRLDRIVELMERMVSSVEQLSGTVERLEETLEPVSRLASRFPGRSRGQPDDES